MRQFYAGCCLIRVDHTIENTDETESKARKCLEKGGIASKFLNSDAPFFRRSRLNKGERDFKVGRVGD